LDTWLLIVGVILVAVIVVFPAGLFGWLNQTSAREVEG
jgi:ABC-type branched-subunit amino acid transport system permease subunit